MFSLFLIEQTNCPILTEIKGASLTTARPLPQKLKISAVLHASLMPIIESLRKRQKLQKLSLAKIGLTSS